MTFARHVALSDDGLGATFQRVRQASGGEEWRWFYDPGLRDDLWTMISTEKAITLLEKELGLPLTWPRQDPDNPPPPIVEPTDEQRRTEMEQRLATNPDDLYARRTLWKFDGRMITPDQLIPGKIYDVAFDLGKYNGVHEGFRYSDVPELADEPGEWGTWYTFEVAESSGSRVGARFTEGDFPVTVLDVSDDELERMFTQLRATHRAWEANRRPTRDF